MVLTKKYKLFNTENPIWYEMVMKKKLSNNKFYIGNPIWYETDMVRNGHGAKRSWYEMAFHMVRNGWYEMDMVRDD